MTEYSAGVKIARLLLDCTEAVKESVQNMSEDMK